MADRHAYTDEEIKQLARDAVRAGHTDEEILSMARRANQSVFFRTLSVVSIVLLGVVGFLAADASRDANSAVDSVHSSQVRSCERSVEQDGVRYIVAQGLQKELERQEQVNYHKLFPNIPPAKLHALLHQQRVASKQQIDALLNVNCAAQFPSP